MTTNPGAGHDDRTAVRRAFLAVGLIFLAALSNVRVPVKLFGQWARKVTPDEVVVQLERFRKLDPYLPTCVPIGYLAPGKHAGVRGQLALAQYAYAPRLIHGTANQTLVICDYVDADQSPLDADSDQWELVADTGEGLKLFRRSER